MTATTTDRPLTDRARDVLKRAGNPFRNYFARNPDDEVCARYHVPELFAAERDLLHAIIDLYRYDPMTHSEVVPVLGNKGAGKTHLLHSIKHGMGGQWQLLVTPGVYQKDTDFLEYLLFQIIDTLLGGGKQKGVRQLEFDVRPTRQDLVLALFKVLTEVFRSLKTPVVVAFDQLEDLLLARRSDDAHKTAEAFFAGIVQVMHQIDGLLFLIFAERGLWNRFVPSLDGYIQDRLNNPVHVPKHGTVKTIRLEAPPADLVRQVVEARLGPCLNELPQAEPFNAITPFTDDQ